MARGETWMVSPSFQRTFTACLVPVSLAHGRPYESFDSGNAVDAADGQSPLGFSRDHAGDRGFEPGWE